jgi:hypothetical protein
LTINKYYIIGDAFIKGLLEQGAKLQQDDGGYFVMGWTQGVASIDIVNTYNCATYLCWMEGEKPVAVKIYFNQFKQV